jgi:nucleotide-binding universal stress UspA family protein
VLGWVTGLARALRAEITLLSVVDPADFQSGDAAKRGSKVSKQGVEGAQKYLDGQAEKHRTAGLNVSSRVAKGKPAKEIVREAKESGADLIAMATHRDRAIERGILGSVTDAVLRTSPVPVMAVRPDGATASGANGTLPGLIVVPLDGSPLAEKSVPVALDTAKACSAELVFLRAVQLPSFAVAGPGAEQLDASYGVSAERDTAMEYLSKFVKQAEAKGLKARAHVGLGSPAARIIESVKDARNALVVITSHGRGGIKRLVLGSVADKVVRASGHPVLVMTQHKG